MMGRNQTMKTYSPRPRDIVRRWYVVDADGAVLGRLASEVAKILRGKHKPIFAPHMDTGDNVIIVNARGVRLTGAKVSDKVYYRHSGYPGGIRGVDYSRLMAQRPALAVEKAVRGMLPKNRLGRQMFHKLAVYEGPDHPHGAQKPARLGLGEIPKWEGLPAPKPRRPREGKKGTGEEKGPEAKRPAARRTGGTRRAAKATGAAPDTAARGRKAAPAGSTAKPAKGRGTADKPAKGATATAKRRARASASTEAKAETQKPKRTVRRPRRKKEE
jgi:large subunit ribosomal protein L13